MSYKILKELYHFPEWSEYYFEYESLKNEINNLAENKNKNRGGDSDSLKKLKVRKNNTVAYTSHQNKLDSEENREEDSLKTIINQIEENINKIKNFQTKTFVALEDDLEVLININSDSKENFKFIIEKILKLNLDNKTNQIDNNLLNSAHIHLFKTAHWLMNFSIVNSIACHKLIIKVVTKHKISYSSLIGCELKNILDSSQNYFTIINTQIEKLIARIVNDYAYKFTNRNEKQALKKLHDKIVKEDQKGNKILISLTILFFIILFLNFLMIFLPDINSLEKEIKFSVFFPAFSFNFIIFSLLAGICGVVYIFRLNRINYIYLFNIDPKFLITLKEYMKIILVLLSLTGLFLLFYKLTIGYFYETFKGLYYIPSVLALSLIIIFFFLPFSILMHSIRWKIFVEIARNFYPFGYKGVKFKDYIFGDILTSLTKPFTNLTLAFCILSCTECRSDSQSYGCTRENYGGLVLILLPYLIRMAQSINKLYYTGMWWPHCLNFFKYFTSISNVIYGYLFKISIFY
jgi:hypothetical protein